MDEVGLIGLGFCGWTSRPPWCSQMNDLVSFTFEADEGCTVSFDPLLSKLRGGNSCGF